MKRSRPTRPLIPERRLRARVKALGRKIRADYHGKDLILVGVLKGAFIFMADLARAIDLPLSCDFLRVSSYGDGTETSGSVRISVGPSEILRGRHVLLVEDIIDTGLTASALLAAIRRHRPRTLKMCALLRKPSRARVDVPVDYLGFTVPDRFVVGYGLDHDGRYRNLPYIAALDGQGD